jgi:NADH dehydrogenase FAD-containing subunit
VLSAIRLAKRTARLGARVTLVSATGDFVDRIRLHEAAAGSPVRTRPLADMLAGTGVELAVAPVAAVERAARRLELADGATLAYDWLVLATGSVTDTRTPGAREHTFTLDGPERVRALAAAVRAAAARRGRVVVVGGGLTAVEAASELAFGHRDLRVALVAPALLPTLGPAARAYASASLARLGVEVELGPKVSAALRGVLATSSGPIRFDLCLWAAGMVASPLAATSGFTVDARGQALVGAALHLEGDQRVFVAGDAAAPAGHLGAPLHMACKTAMPLGASAADNIAAVLAGGEPRPFSWGDYGVCVSLGRKDGVIERRDRHGSPTSTIRGRAGAWIKELVSRYPGTVLRLERRFVGLYRYPRAAPPRAALPAPSEDVAR